MQNIEAILTWPQDTLWANSLYGVKCHSSIACKFFSFRDAVKYLQIKLSFLNYESHFTFLGTQMNIKKDQDDISFLTCDILTFLFFKNILYCFPFCFVPISAQIFLNSDQRVLQSILMSTCYHRKFEMRCITGTDTKTERKQ